MSIVDAQKENAGRGQHLFESRIRTGAIALVATGGREYREALPWHRAENRTVTISITCGAAISVGFLNPAFGSFSTKSVLFGTTGSRFVFDVPPGI